VSLLCVFCILSEEMALQQHSQRYHNSRQKLMKSSEMEELLEELNKEAAKGNVTCVTVGIPAPFFGQAAPWLQDRAADAARLSS
jgi:hypothetical protein